MKKIFLCLLLVGCTTGPKYEKPSVATPETFRGDWKPAQPSDNVLKGPWWTLYNDPVLNKLMEQVNISNQTIAASVAGLRQAQALIKNARAQYYPNLSLNPGVNVTKGSSSPMAPTYSDSKTHTVISVPLEASWVPDLWGKVQNTVKQNVAKAQFSAADLENVRLAQQVSLAITYYELRAQDELITLYDSTVAAYKESLDLNKVLAKTGIGGEEAVVQAKTQLNSTESQATNLRIAREQYEHAIALLMGQPASSFTLPAAPFNPVLPEIPAGVPSQLLERRPDIAAAERNMAAANATIGIATSAYYPQLTLTGILGIGAETLNDLVKSPTTFWSVGAVLSETLFDGGARSATVDQYKALYDQTVANYRQTVLSAFQQVEDSLSSLRLLKSQIQQQDAAVDSSQRYVNIAKSRYRLGLDPYLNVIIAQVSLLNNQQTALSVKAQQVISSLRLVEALGGGWNSSQMPTEQDLLSDSKK